MNCCAAHVFQGYVRLSQMSQWDLNTVCSLDGILMISYHLFYVNLCCLFGEGNGNPLQYSCLENPMGGGAWWAAVHGVAKSWTWLSDFTFTFHFHALEKEMTTRSSVLAWRIPGTGEPGGLPSMGSHRVRHNWINLAAAACCLLEITASLLRAYKPLKWITHFSKMLLRTNKFSGLRSGERSHLCPASTSTAKPFEKCIDSPTASHFLGWLSPKCSPPHWSTHTASSYEGPVICGTLAGRCGHLMCSLSGRTEKLVGSRAERVWGTTSHNPREKLYDQTKRWCP